MKNQRKLPKETSQQVKKKFPFNESVFFKAATQQQSLISFRKSFSTFYSK